MVFATDTRLSPDATLALFKLATKDARPHLVVRGVTSELWRPRLVSAPMHMHEGAPSDRVESAESLIVRAGALHRRRPVRGGGSRRRDGASCCPRRPINRRRAARWPDR